MKKPGYVEYSGAYLSQECIEKCIKEINEIKTNNIENPELRIITTKEVIYVDISLIGYFILFKNEIPTIKISIEINNNPIINEQTNKLLFLLEHYKVHAYFISGVGVFNIMYNSVNYAANTINKSAFVCSEDFMPSLLINKNTFDVIFNNANNIQQLNAILYIDKNEKLYQNCRNFFYEYINKNQKDNIRIFSLLYLCNVLLKLKILNIFLDVEYKEKQITRKKLYASHLVGDNAYKYYIDIQSVANEIANKPPIYHFIFSLFVSSDMLPNEIENEKNKIENYVLQVKSLWEFTKEIVPGLKELAKNIIEHSSNKCGVISGRIFNRQRLEEFNKTNPNTMGVFEKYFNQFSDKSTFLNINVIDNGESGVLETLFNKINTSDFEKYDKEIIKKGDITFNSFLDVSEGVKLIHQAKRVTAHLGLLFFSQLIINNNGIIRAGTWNLKDNVVERRRDDVLVLKDKINNDLAPLPPFGTNYNVLIPFDPKNKIKPLIKQKIEVPTEITRGLVKGMESLLNYKVKDFNEDYNGEIENINYLFRIYPNITKISTKEEETSLWKEINDYLLESHKEFIRDKKAYVCLNLNDLKIDGSALFRLLGNWELFYTGCPLILYDLNIETFFELIKINEIHWNRNKDNLFYWNDNSIIICYNYQTIRNNERFYFTDILWGKTDTEFNNINFLISKSNFNSITIEYLNRNNKKPDTSISSLNIEEAIKSGVFVNKSTLLPFDLLLNTSNEISLFEQNTMVLLQNELSSNNIEKDGYT